MFLINAVIPIAGRGIRLMPQTIVTKKALLPLYHNGNLEPAIYILIKEILACNYIDTIYLVIAPGDEGFYNPLLSSFRDKVRYIFQSEPEGLGHAVYLAKQYVGDRFLLCLGDMIYKSNVPDISCIYQIVQYSMLEENSVMGLHYIPLQDVSINGMVQCIKIDTNFRKVDIQRVYEKPSIQFAIQNSLQEGVFGCYVLNREIFDLIDLHTKEHGEIQLSSALDQLAIKRKLKGYIIDGESYDIGTPEKYYESFVKFGEKNQK